MPLGASIPAEPTIGSCRGSASPSNTRSAPASASATTTWEPRTVNGASPRFHETEQVARFACRREHLVADARHHSTVGIEPDERARHDIHALARARVDELDLALLDHRCPGATHADDDQAGGRVHRRRPIPFEPADPRGRRRNPRRKQGVGDTPCRVLRSCGRSPLGRRHRASRDDRSRAATSVRHRSCAVVDVEGHDGDGPESVGRSVVEPHDGDHGVVSHASPVRRSGVRRAARRSSAVRPPPAAAAPHTATKRAGEHRPDRA